MMAATKRDYYEILSIQRNADGEEIKRAYRKLAMQYHPDRNSGDEEAALRFKEAAEAYDVLSNPDKRQRYDRYGHAGLEGMGGPDFGNVQSIFDQFADLFGDIFGGAGARRGPQAGRSLGMELELELVEAARGCKKTVTIPREENCSDCNGSGARRGTSPAICRACNGHGVVIRSQGFFRMQQTCHGRGGRGVVITDPCPSCHGRGRVTARRTLEVTVPPGVDNGMRLPMRGEGEAGAPGGQRGDLILEIHVREHPMFKRDGDHLVCHVPITFSQAALGGEIQVPTLDGPVNYTLQRGIQSGEAVRIGGKGIPNVRSKRPGDLLVVLMVETPRSLTKRQEELLRELAELDKKHVSLQRQSFFDKVKRLFTPAEPDAKDKGYKEEASS